MNNALGARQLATLIEMAIVGREPLRVCFRVRAPLNQRQMDRFGVMTSCPFGLFGPEDVVQKGCPMSFPDVVASAKSQDNYLHAGHHVLDPVEHLPNSLLQKVPHRNVALDQIIDHSQSTRDRFGIVATNADDQQIRYSAVIDVILQRRKKAQRCSTSHSIDASVNARANGTAVRRE